MGRLALVPLALMAVALALPAEDDRLEEMRGKTVLVFTPHPDDDLFGAGGTIALLNRKGNKVYVALYTNDDKGSYDPEMTSQHLAHIRKAEEEAAEVLLGTLKENLLWMGYDDGMLEYAPQPKLVEEATAIIRRIRPDVLLSIDPAEWYERWHKTDHRMAAFNTIDAVRAAEFWLYFPNQRLQQHLEPYTVPVILLLSSAAGSQLLRQHRQCGRSQARSGDETRSASLNPPSISTVPIGIPQTWPRRKRNLNRNSPGRTGIMSNRSGGRRVLSNTNARKPVCQA